MGTGIGFSAAKVAGVEVLMCDSSRSSLENCKKLAASFMDRAIQKQKATPEQKEEVLSRIKCVENVEQLGEVDFIIEAIVENFEAKASVLKALDKVVKPSVILATNTSSIPITRIAAATARPQQVIGMHFFHPVQVLNLVEVIQGAQTSEETLKSTVDLATRMGKVTTRSADRPGFISNRVLMPWINEAIHALNEGVGTATDIDTTMKLGTNVPMGPLTLADFIGLDTCHAIMTVLYTHYGDPKFKPCILLTKHVEAGWFGKKSGRGFYDYSEARSTA
eukprot:CAMPEP_0196654836 /NCGR_PEP_ID=MMETSP1086-20130531/4570_1 /TAXON_ID=77921 /ORGANISM="Cyanoptyche  gloeocystis , Strain SAG4.97" /LENGTH=277 /DNA_ID=CAMNT_0041986825 /DNA_START=51 /DNA_END=884 /DNA_ORIENTATION=+